ncbi:MAG: LysM peptidoglycan-binding domain-containing protein [Akkermansia sp.]|nr:LysM peptidoglycan-binding domain-containing protein [Akkermansia sp.]
MKIKFSQLIILTAGCSALCSCNITKQRVDYSWFKDTVTSAQDDTVTVEAGQGLTEALPASAAADFTPPSSTAPTVAHNDSESNSGSFFSQQQQAPQQTAQPAPQATASGKSWWSDLFNQLQPANTPEPQQIAGTYMVKPGDTLSVIARSHGVSVSTLAAVNNLSNPNALRIGQVLTIPSRTASAAPAAQAPAPQAAPQQAVAPAPQPAASATNYYTVCSGDTLSGIARRHNTTIAKIMLANNMTTAQAHRLRIGQRIIIPRN